MPLAAGTRLGPYEILAKLGEGGMGEVYRARDTKLQRDVAIKVLTDATLHDPERRKRFEREARTVAALDHPNIVTIHSIEADGDLLFLTMQLVDGTSLADAIPSGGIPLQSFFSAAIPLVDAVATAHQRGIVHRDLKPSNVMLTRDKRVKVLDFGLAKESEAGSEASTIATANDLTAAGQILGTVAYMSPEQAESREVDHRSDVFSLGVMLYEMAVGTRPFNGHTPLSTLTAILRDAPEPITTIKPSLPTHLGRIIRRCLEKDPARRYQSTGDLRNDLDDLQHELESAQSKQSVAPAPIPSPRGFRFPAAIALTLVAGAVGGAWIVASLRPAELQKPEVTSHQL